MHRSTVDYRHLRDVDQTVSWKKFFVEVEGITKGAHFTIVEELKSSGQTEVMSLEESDYILLFCPIASRVGTDIGEALEAVPGGKPIILVVMHHTFDSDYQVPHSQNQVKKQIVRLTVDSLFHEGKLLTSKRNDIALYEIKKFLRDSGSQFFWQTRWNLYKWLRHHWLKAVVVVGLTASLFFWMKGFQRAVTDANMTERNAI